ncbi:sulfatase-like hydrolase/transferase [Flagellimonas sp. CMM7]|uniref:sulfatase-like hydrolase/transferase n=1 Tax=Flagellimonas sp. CMM7 TaxID=2654676 RepID=UPI0013D7098A|nr:sulfatase-like hydrolase/transferase [Flagellimonas sp. CMM7]UII78750.1 sulfatase-like hydrolase/transferase [Flagellimonas sp. CMM7]
MKAVKLFCLLVLINCTSSEPDNLENVLPNIIFILVDDLGKEWVSAYGAEEAVTPNIDALAKSGTLFQNVYSMPQCTPTRVTFLTGQYPFRHGWVNHWDVPRWGGGAHFDETLNPSITNEMKKAGYKTCIAGKWQIDDFRVEPDALTKAGFDEYCMWTGYEAGVPASAERYQDPYLFTKAGSKTYEGEFGPDVFKDFIIDFIKDNKDEPMFVYYPMVLTHTPLVNTPLDSATTKLGKHKAMLKYTDIITGEIVKAIDEAGIRDNTLIIWTTDNGTTGKISGLRNGHKIKGRKGFTEEPGICEPFIASWPGTVASNAVSEALIDFSDFYPTFIDVSGGTPAKEVQLGNTTHQIDGHSFKKALLHGGSSQRKWILGMGGGNYAKLTEKGVENQYRYRDRVIRNERYKLWIDSKRQPESFYDLQKDPLEKNNIIDSLYIGEREENYQQLLKVAESFPEKDSDPKYSPNPQQAWDVEITAKSEIWKK